MNELEKCRQEIDEIDKQLIELFEKRMDVAVRVAGYKVDNEFPIYNSVRESQVISKNVDRLKEEKYEILARRFFIGLMELSRELQEEVIKRHNK